MSFAPGRMPAIYMQNNTIAVGKYLVTPLTKLIGANAYAASVSLRRGMHDRVFRLLPRFTSESQAMCYALDQGRRMAAHSQLP